MPCFGHFKTMQEVLACIQCKFFEYICMVSFSSFVGEDAAAKLEPFATLTPAASLVNRDLEKVQSRFLVSKILHDFLNSMGLSDDNFLVLLDMAGFTTSCQETVR